MTRQFDMSDYVDVAERITEFRKKYPEGSLQSSVIRWPADGFPFVAVEARAYRTATDERPGVGLAWENFPGRTPYTKDSELQNAETSAWGRAIVAVLAADTKRGIASRQEVSRSSAPREEGEPARTGARRDGRGQGRERVGADSSSAETPSGASDSAEAVAGSEMQGEGITGPATPNVRVFPKDPKTCKHRAVLVPYEGEQVCSGCGLPDALIGVGDEATT